MTGRFVLSLFAVLCVMLLGAERTTAQSSVDYVKINPPPGMRWKTRDQSTTTNDTYIVDKEGNTWVRRSALVSFSQSMVLVQLVGDTSGADEWMSMRDEAPYLRLQADPDWNQPQYRVFTSDSEWRRQIGLIRNFVFQRAGQTGSGMPSVLVGPIYTSAANPDWQWWSPDQGPLLPDAELSGRFKVLKRQKAGQDVPYSVTVEDFSTAPATEKTRPGGYELYRNYYPTFNPDGSYTLGLAGDFSFQKDYLLPEGTHCVGNSVVLPDGTCSAPNGDGNGPAPTGPQPAPTAITQASPRPGLPYVPAPPVPAVAPGPLTSPSLPNDACSGAPFADVCGEAHSRAADLVNQVPLLQQQLTVHQNPVIGVTRVPTWFWVEGYDGQAVTATTDVQVPWTHDWSETVVSEDGTAADVPRRATGIYHLSLLVRLRPARYVWDFGDGTSVNTGSLGKAYPDESDVQRSYQHHSHDQPDRRYHFGLGIDWVSDWQVSGDASGQGPGPSRYTMYQNSFQVDDVGAWRCADTGCPSN